MGAGQSRQVPSGKLLPPLPDGWDAERALRFREDYLNGDMTDWGDLVDVTDEPLRLTEEGRAALVWATEFHLRGQTDAQARRAAFRVVDAEPGPASVVERLARLQASLRL